jgi:hypothetical protein
MCEAALRAEEWDTYAQRGLEHPQWDDTPDSCGDTYYLGGILGTAIEDYSAFSQAFNLPEPCCFKCNDQLYSLFNTRDRLSTPNKN